MIHCCGQLLPKVYVDTLRLALAIHIYCVVPEESDKVGTKRHLSTLVFRQYSIPKPFLS